MTSSLAHTATHDLLADDLFEEVSSIRTIASPDLLSGPSSNDTGIEPRFDLDIDVDIHAHLHDRDFDDPAPIYARPVALVGGQRCDFLRSTYLGTRFPAGIIESATWEEELRAAGASDAIITRCRRYLRENVL